MIATDHIAASTRAELAALWQARATSEASVRSVFDHLVTELVVAGADPRVIEMARHAGADEARHAEVCARLAAAYRGAEVDRIAQPPVRLPRYVDDARLRATLHVANLCCIGETLAVAFVGACVDACADPTLRAIHRRHQADEIRHARIGWAHLASLSRCERAAVAPWIAELIRVNVATWERRIGELPTDGVAGHGYPPRADLLAAIRGAVADVVLPGFAYLGIST